MSKTWLVGGWRIAEALDVMTMNIVKKSIEEASTAGVNYDRSTNENSK